MSPLLVVGTTAGLAWLGLWAYRAWASGASVRSGVRSQDVPDLTPWEEIERGFYVRRERARFRTGHVRAWVIVRPPNDSADPSPYPPVEWVAYGAHGASASGQVGVVGYRAWAAEEIAKHEADAWLRMGGA